MTFLLYMTYTQITQIKNQKNLMFSRQEFSLTQVLKKNVLLLLKDFIKMRMKNTIKTNPNQIFLLLLLDLQIIIIIKIIYTIK